MNFPEEMIAELLIRLPQKSVTKFKCVSKEWNKLISGTEFRKWYQYRYNKTCPIGFVYHPIRPSLQVGYIVQPAKFVGISYIDKEELNLCHDFQEFDIVVGSSKGLLLIRRNLSFYVYDLLTRKHVQLPETLEKNKYVVTGFISKECEQNCQNNIKKCISYLSYKVVVIGGPRYRDKTKKFEVESYSSVTGKWYKSMITVALEFRFDIQCTAKVIGGVLHWVNFSNKNIIAYDPENLVGRATLIEFPSSNTLRRLSISGTQDGQLLCMSESNHHDIDLWVLRRKYERASYLDEDIIDRSQWVVFIKISKTELTQSLLDFLPTGPASYRSVDIHPQDSNLILLIMNEDEFVSYNIIGKRVETILSTGKGEGYTLHGLSYVHFEWPSWPCL